MNEAERARLKMRKSVTAGEEGEEACNIGSFYFLGNKVEIEFNGIRDYYETRRSSRDKRTEVEMSRQG